MRKVEMMRGVLQTRKKWEMRKTDKGKLENTGIRVDRGRNDEL